MADSGWKRPFDDLISLPGGRALVTLEDAGNYITRLSKAEHATAEWQAAMEALILVETSVRADDVCAHRYHAGIEPRQVRSGDRATRQARQSLQGHSLAGNGGYATLRFSAEVLPRLFISS